MIYELQLGLSVNVHQVSTYPTLCSVRQRHEYIEPLITALLLDFPKLELLSPIRQPTYAYHHKAFNCERNTGIIRYCCLHVIN